MIKFGIGYIVHRKDNYGKIRWGNGKHILKFKKQLWSVINMNLNKIKDWFKNYGGYLSPLVAFLLIALYAELAGSIAYYKTYSHRLLPNLYREIFSLVRNGVVILLLLSGFMGIFVFDKVLKKKYADSRFLNQILGFIAFFILSIILLLCFMFLASVLFGTIWIA